MLYTDCMDEPSYKSNRNVFSASQLGIHRLMKLVKRVDRAFDDFFRRLQEGQKPGYPALNRVPVMIP
jgi:hypothetical protein